MPIKQGYKIWALGDSGYIYNWLWYPKALGIEGLQGDLNQYFGVDTQVLIILLVKSLPISKPIFTSASISTPGPPIAKYTLYLDNLFINIPLANALI